MARIWLSRLFLGGLLLLVPFSLGACAADGGSPDLGCSASSTPCLKGTATVVLQTSKGEVQLQLDGAAAPLTAGNFVDLVNRGTYNGTVFHRVVREPVPFVVQGGGPCQRRSQGFGQPIRTRQLPGSGQWRSPADSPGDQAQR